MPGVPSGRACDACRKQKKKCDEIKPSCSRCTRLDIPCIGSGQQRYKFKVESGFSEKPRKGRKAKTDEGAKALKKKEKAVVAVPPSPAINGTALLAGRFVNAIKSSTDVRYNLGWSYGIYLNDVPQRLGTSVALDAAADALITAHSSFCTPGTISIDAILKYSRALNVLRDCLNDPVQARASNTLGAVSLLLVCQNFLGNPDIGFTGHVEGAVQILKARRHMAPQDEFEKKLLATLRGPVVFEGLFNDKIDLSPEEWKTLIETDIGGTTPMGQILRCLGRMPDIMRRGRNIFVGDPGHAELRDETRLLYEKVKLIVEELRQQWTTAEAPGTYSPVITVRLHSHYQRSYVLGLGIAIILNCVLSAFDAEDDNLIVESTHYATEILDIAGSATRYRPIGANYMSIFLMAAWAGTNDKSLRSLIEFALRDYQGDFYRDGPMKNMETELEDMTYHMRLLTPSSPSTLSGGSGYAPSR